MVDVMASAADEGGDEGDDGEKGDDGGADDPTPGKRKGDGADGGTRKKVKTAAGNALREIQKALHAANAGSADGDAEE